MRRQSLTVASTVALMRAPARCAASSAGAAVLLCSTVSRPAFSSSSGIQRGFGALVRSLRQPVACYSGSSAVAMTLCSYVTKSSSSASRPEECDGAEDDYNDELPARDDPQRSQRSLGGHRESAAHSGLSDASTRTAAASSPQSASSSPTEGATSPPQEPTVTVLDQRNRSVEYKRVGRFEDLADAPKWLASNLAALQYPSTTEIQAVTIPALLDGHDLIALAPTGSGKTVAFAVPVLMHFERSPERLPTVLVLAPTRELVQQTAKVFLSLTNATPLVVCEAYGGASREIQERRMQRGCDILVATPGRLNDFLEAGVVRLDHLKYLIVDEGDRLLDMGFKPQLDTILSYMNPDVKRQTMIWSATWPAGVQRLAAALLTPERLMIRAGGSGGADGGAQVNKNIKQHIRFATGSREKVELLAEMIENGTIQEAGCKMIIFVERQVDTEGAADALVKRLGIRPSSVGVLHGGMAQKARDYVMHNFKTNRCRILVATDVASRGLDIPDVTVVVNFHAPKDIDAYCHRIGRTGRAGRTGEAYTFLCPTNDGALARDLVPFLHRCNMEVPEQLEQIAWKRDAYAGGGRDRRYSSRSGGNRHGRGDGGHRYGSRTGHHRDYRDGSSSEGGFSDGRFPSRTSGSSSWRSSSSTQRHSAAMGDGSGSTYQHRKRHGGDDTGFDM